MMSFCRLSIYNSLSKAAKLRRVGVVLALCLGLTGGPLSAQTGLGAAAVYACDAERVCHSDGGCASGGARIFIIESFAMGGAQGPIFVAEPLPGTAAAIFDERPVTPLSPGMAPEEIFARYPPILESPLYFSQPVAGEVDTYLVIRSTVENDPLHSERTLTQYRCEQQAFR